jgi:plastocyanin
VKGDTGGDLLLGGPNKDSLNGGPGFDSCDAGGDAGDETPLQCETDQPLACDHPQAVHFAKISDRNEITPDEIAICQGETVEWKYEGHDRIRLVSTSAPPGDEFDEPVGRAVKVSFPTPGGVIYRVSPFRAGSHSATITVEAKN